MRFLKLFLHRIDNYIYGITIAFYLFFKNYYCWYVQDRQSLYSDSGCVWNDFLVFCWACTCERLAIQTITEYQRHFYTVVRLCLNVLRAFKPKWKKKNIKINMIVNMIHSHEHTHHTNTRMQQKALTFHLFVILSFEIWAYYI